MKPAFNEHLTDHKLNDLLSNSRPRRQAAILGEIKRKFDNFL